MRYLILSDMHANRHALDAVLADASVVGYDAVLVLGDLVGYGADPGAVIDRTLELNPVAMIRGNHDKVAAGSSPPPSSTTWPVGRLNGRPKFYHRRSSERSWVCQRGPLSSPR